MKKFFFFLMLVILSSTASAMSANRLVSWWNFEETENGTFVDNRSRYSLSGLGSPEVDGIIGSGFGTYNNNVLGAWTLNESVVWAPADPDGMAVAFWFRMDDGCPSSNYVELIGNWENVAPSSGWVLMYRYLNGGCRLRYVGHDLDTSTSSALFGSSGGWFFIGFNHYRNTTIHFYINNTISYDTVTNSIIDKKPDYFGNLSISHNPTVATMVYAEGVFDEVMIFNRTLTDDEWDTLWNAGRGRINPFVFIISLSHYNVTSAYHNTDIWNSDQLSYVKTVDSTPTIIFNSSEATYCAISTNSSSGVGDANFTEMNDGVVNRNCTGGQGTKGHSCTVIASDTLHLENDYVYVACENLTGNDYQTTNSTSGKLAIVLKSEELLLEGFNKSITAELGSNITIYSEIPDSTACLNIDYYGFGTNYSCVNGVNSFDLNISYFALTEFNDTTIKKTLPAPDAVGFELDNRSELVNVEINISGNSSLKDPVLSYGATTKQFRGNFTGNILVDRHFRHSGEWKTEHNLTFLSEGDNFIYYNVTAPVRALFIQLWGNDLDKDNDYTHTDYFENETFIDGRNTTSSYPAWVWDNFSNEARTTFYTDGDGSASVDLDNGEYDASVGTVVTCPSQGTSDSDSDGMNVATLYQNISRFKEIQFEANCLATADASVAPGSGDGSGQSSSYCRFVITNSPTLASYQTLLYSSASCLVGIGGCHQEQTASGTILLKRVEDGIDSVSFKIYADDVYQGTTSSLNGNINIGYVGTTSAACSNQGRPSGADGGSYYTLEYIKYSGIANNYTDATNYSTNSTMRSLDMFTAPNNIDAATLTTTEIKPVGCTIDYWISNDNSTTWEIAYGGERHVFSSADKYLMWMANLNCSSREDTAAILDATLDITPGSVSNLSIDVEADGVSDYQFNSTLNSTNSPRNVTFNGTTVLTTDGLLPIMLSSDTAGRILINISVLNVTPNAVEFNYSEFENCSNCKIDFDFIGNSLNLSSFVVQYIGGNDTINVLAHTPDYSINVSHNITYFYSGYNYSFPSRIEYLEFIPWSPTAKNVSPYGQTYSKPIFNITMLNYARNLNFSVYLNETHSCVNLTASPTGNKSDGRKLNASWYELLTDKPYQSSGGMWMWADLQCNYTSWRLWEPDFYFRTCCHGCDICDETI